MVDSKNILEKLDIVDVVSRYISLSKKGSDYIGLCPFHDDHSPSLHVSKDKQIFKCFTCGVGGNAISFISNYEHISYKEALYKAAEIAGIKLDNNERVIPHKTEKDCMKTFVDYYKMSIELNSNIDAKKYCDDRGLTYDVRQKFNIGYSPADKFQTIKYVRSCGFSANTIEQIGISGFENNQFYDKNADRIIFPIQDSQGDFVGLSARKFRKGDESPKYINTAETLIFHKSDILYNFYNAKISAKKDGYLYILEGFIDVISLYKVGISSAVGLMGVALGGTKSLNNLKYLNVELRLCLDNDDAGISATYELCKKLLKEGINFRVVRKNLSLGKDSGEILDNQGKDILLKYLNDLQDGIDFVLEYLSKKFDLNVSTQKKLFVNECFKIFVLIKDELDRELFLDKISKTTGFDKITLKTTFKKYLTNLNKNTNNAVIESVEKNTKTNLDNSSKIDKKVANIERKVFGYVISNIEAYKMFINSNQMFFDRIYASMMIYLSEYYKHDDNLQISGLIDYLSKIGVDNETINRIVEIYNSSSLSRYDRKTFEEMLNKLYYEQSKYSIKNMISNEYDKDKKKQLVEELRKLVLENKKED